MNWYYLNADAGPNDNFYAVSTGNSRAFNADGTSTLTFDKTLLKWWDNNRTWHIDTADNTTKKGSATFYVLVVTRGNVKEWHPVTTNVICGRETIKNTPLPGGLVQWRVQQNTTTYETTMWVHPHFWSDMPFNCPITNYTLEGIVDAEGNQWCNSS